MWIICVIRLLQWSHQIDHHTSRKMPHCSVWLLSISSSHNFLAHVWIFCKVWWWMADRLAGPFPQEGHWIRLIGLKSDVSVTRWPWLSLPTLPPESVESEPFGSRKLDSSCCQSQSFVRIHYDRFVGWIMVWSRHQNQAAYTKACNALYLTESLHLLHIEGNLPQLLQSERLGA